MIVVYSYQLKDDVSIFGGVSMGGPQAQVFGAAEIDSAKAAVERLKNNPDFSHVVLVQGESK